MIELLLHPGGDALLLLDLVLKLELLLAQAGKVFFELRTIPVQVQQFLAIFLRFVLRTSKDCVETRQVGLL